jgi:hypothetical protein
MPRLILLPLCLFLAFSASSVLAESGGGYDLSWSKIASGGISTSKSVDFGYALGGTIAQSVSRQLSGGPFVLQDGFWAAAGNPLGIQTLRPTSASVSPRQPISYTLEWQVPPDQVWRTLSTLQLRIRNDDNTLIWVKAHFDKANKTNDFSVYNEATGAFGPSFLAGSPVQLETRCAKLDVSTSTVTGSGPTGHVVTVDYALTFKPNAGGTSNIVEVEATDNAGNMQGFEQDGKLVVTPAQEDADT